MQRISERSLAFLAAALSVGAAAVHASVVGEHVAEWWGYGLFFLVVTAAQAIFAPLVLLRPSRRVLLAGIVGNLAIIGLWVLTRTAGIPLFGPGAGEVEAVGRVDVVSKTIEALLVVVLGALLSRVEHGEPAATTRRGHSH